MEHIVVPESDNVELKLNPINTTRLTKPFARSRVLDTEMTRVVNKSLSILTTHLRPGFSSRRTRSPAMDQSCTVKSSVADREGRLCSLAKRSFRG